MMVNCHSTATWFPPTNSLEVRVLSPDLRTRSYSSLPAGVSGHWLQWQSALNCPTIWITSDEGKEQGEGAGPTEGSSGGHTTTGRVSLY